MASELDLTIVYEGGEDGWIRGPTDGRGWARTSDLSRVKRVGEEPGLGEKPGDSGGKPGSEEEPDTA